MPDATDISVLEVLEKFDGPFEAAAKAIGNGEFSLWVGSGISRKAPNLGDLIDRAIEFVRVRAVAPATVDVYLPVLQRILQLARVDRTAMEPYFTTPFSAWPQYDAVRDELWNKYSKLLDARVKGEPSDFLLWNAVDIRDAFANPPPPAAQHMCIAILIMEGAVQSIASGNWDGFIEAAVERLSSGAAGILQVVVDPDHLRDPPAQARLLKFHGCIIHATADPTAYRKYLTGSHTQITDWPNNPAFVSMRNAVTELATNSKSLVLGLSIQDSNLQGVFSAAKLVHPWPWPCAPAPPAHIFCEDEIKEGQRDVLKIVYGEAYNNDMDAIELSAHLRAWAEQVLIALVFKLLETKLSVLMALGLSDVGKAGFVGDLAVFLKHWRDSIADLAVGDRTEFVNQAISLWSRALAIYRTGALPPNAEIYEAISASSPMKLPADQNAKSANLGQFGVALSLLQSGREGGQWRIGVPASVDLSAGIMNATPTWPGAETRPIYIVKSATEAINLQKQGAFATDKAIVLHADDAWQQMIGAGTSSRRPRGAPGRTGRITTQHVSLGHLVETSTDVGDLVQRFESEVAL